MIRATTLVGVTWLVGGCGGAGKDLLQPDQPPVAAFAKSCQGIACSFTNASTDADGRIVSYRWAFGDGSSEDIARDVRHTFNGSGSFVVALTVADEDGATGRADSVVHITVRANNPPAAGFAPTCAELVCSFADLSTDADGRIVTYRWSFGDGGPDDTVREPTHTYAAAGDYTVRLAVTDDSGATGSATQLVHVAGHLNRSPRAAFGVACAEFTCTFSDSSADGDGRIVQWHWIFGDGLEADTPSPVHTFAAADTYQVTLSVTDDGGLTDSAFRWVPVPVAPTVLAVNPTRLGFSVHAFAPDQTPSQTITISGLRTGRIKWSARGHPSWLTIRPAEGTTPGTVSVSVNSLPPPIGINGYRPSVFNAAFTISGVGVRNTPVTVPVTLFIRYTR